MFSLNTNLLIGDIILIRGGKLHSKAIASASKGHFSHACLCVGPRNIIESITSTGVQYSSVVRFVFQDAENVAILRPVFGSDADQRHFRDKIQKVVASDLGKRYDYFGAAVCLTDIQLKANKDKLFCSQLVASIFFKIGFPLFEKKAENVSPNDFQKCKRLENVTDTVLSEISCVVKERYQRQGESLVGLDSIKGSSKSELHHILSDYFDCVAPVFEKHGVEPPRNIPHAIDVLIDPKCRMASREFDKTLTDQFDILQVLENIKKIAVIQEFDDINHLCSEINKYGLDFLKAELLYSHAFIKDAKATKVKIEKSLSICKAKNSELNFRFLERAISYYEFQLQSVSFAIDNEDKVFSLLFQAFKATADWVDWSQYGGN